MAEVATSKILYPSDRQGTLVYSTDQFSPDNGITRVLINSQYFDRIIEGGIRAVHIGVYPNGVDMTAKLNQAFVKPFVKHIIFDNIAKDDGTANKYTINGTLTIPNDVLVTVRGKNSFTGIGTINGGIWDIDETAVIWDSTLTANPYTFTLGYVPPIAWGFLPDTGIDVTDILQKIVLWAVNAPIRKIYISRVGVYIINNLCILKDKGLTNTGQASLTIEGGNASNGITGAVKFYTTDPNAATFLTIQCTGLYIRNITCKGANPYNTPNPIIQDWTYGNTIRHDYLTPHCCMASDVLWAHPSSLINLGNLYPGVDPSFFTCTEYTGSANVIFENCVFSDYNVIMANGLSGCPSGENIVIRFSIALNFQVFWAAGQLQSRENVIENVFAFNFQTFLSNQYGTFLGDVPSVRNCNLNQGKYLFDISGADFTFVRFSDGYSEAMWSLGKSASQGPVEFTNWNYTQAYNNQYSPITAPSPVWCECAVLQWEGGKMEGFEYKSIWPINALHAEFGGGVFIRGHVPFLTNVAFFDKLIFRNVNFTGNGGTGGLPLVEGSINNSAQILLGTDESSYYHRFLLPGSKFTTRNHRTWENVGSKIDRIYVGAYAVTLNTTTDKLTFTPDNIGRFAGGNMITIDETVNNGSDIYSASTTALGWVSAIGASTVELSYVPAGVVNGATYTMYITRVPLYIGRHIGTVNVGSPVITNVITEGDSFVEGDFIKGVGIPNGARIQSANYGAGTLTMSMNATGGANGVELYDVKAKVTSDNALFDYFSTLVSVFQPNFFWFAGDEVMNVTGISNIRSWYFTAAGKMNGSPAPAYIPVGILVLYTSQLTNDNGYVQANIIKLTGTPFESGPDPHPGDPTTKAPAAFDGNFATHYESITSDINPNNYVGLILDNRSVLTKIKICPVDGISIEGFKIQGSNISESAGYVDLFTLPNVPFFLGGFSTYLVPPTTASYKYLRLYQTSNFILQVAEIEFDGYPVDQIDAVPTDGSSNAVSSNGVYDSLNAPVTEYTDNADALANGLVAGMRYRTGDVLKIVH